MTAEQWRDLEQLYDAVRGLPEAEKSHVLGRVNCLRKAHLQRTP